MNKESLAPLSRNNIFFRCVEDSSDAIMITDERGILIYINKAWQNIYGYSDQEAIGNTPRLIRGIHQKDTLYKEMWGKILDPNIGFWKGEIINRAKEGHEVPVFLTITPYRNEGGKVEGYMGIAVDITQRKQLESQLLQQDRLASVGLLASGLAHEVGTPLGVIRGRAEYLQMIAKDDAKIKAGLEIIIAQIDRISKLIYSLLNLARAEKADPKQAVSISKVVEDVLNLVEQKARKSGISFQTQIPSHAGVKAESDKLTQVFLNLVMNAIHAIEMRRSDDSNPKKISISAKDEKGFWNIKIQDTGCGISKENMVNLFKPFFTTKEVGSGTGLGLVITLKIIKSFGGEIHVESQEGHGATFLLHLPKL